jgi:hypothetical protein
VTDASKPIRSAQPSHEPAGATKSSTEPTRTSTETPAAAGATPRRRTSASMADWSLAPSTRRAASARLAAQDAELVALGVGQHYPRLLALADVDPGGAEGLGPSHLGIAVVGP